MSIHPASATPEKPLTVGLLGNYSITSELIKSRLPEDFEEREGVQFRFLGPEGIEADVLIVFNEIKQPVSASFREGYLWNWIQEPFSPRRGFHFVRKPARRYSRVFSHYVNTSDRNQSRFQVSPPHNPWWLEKSYSELASETPPAKQNLLSAIASNKRLFPTHKLRDSFIETLLTDRPQVEVFGRGREKDLAIKADGILPFQFSLAIENSSSPHYWTEKIVDCYLGWTVPIYYGAPNISDYFPERSFVWLPLDDPPRALSVVDEILSGKGNWGARLPFVREARDLCLHNYNIGIRIAEIVNGMRNKVSSAPLIRKKLHPDAPILRYFY